MKLRTSKKSSKRLKLEVSEIGGPTPLNIALDYDSTYTASRDLWDTFIESALRQGHNVMIVTMRSEHDPVVIDHGIPIYYTDLKAKKKYMKAQGIKVDIVIDDKPEAWLNDKVLSAEKAEARRVKHELQRSIELDL